MNNTTTPDTTLEFSERWAGVAFLECVVLGFFVVKVMINRFISFESTPFFIYLTIFLGYFLSASIVFLIPVDISNVKISTFFPPPLCMYIHMYFYI